MDVLQENNENKGKFYILVDGKQEAEMTYTWVGRDRFIIDHTDVSDVLRGKSAGKQMVMAAVEYARQNGLKIIPLCPFAKSVFDKVTEIRDVL